MIETIKCCDKTIYNVWNNKIICLCSNNFLYQWYNILFFDHLSITQYNKFCQIRNLSFRGGEHRQRLTDLNNTRENEDRIDYDYKVGQKVLVRKEGILRKSESIWHRKPWLITTVHTNGTLTVQHGNKLEWMNIRRAKPFVENLDNE